MSDEEWADHVFGSGASTWSWWYSISQNAAGDVIIKYVDPDSWDGSEEGISTTYTTLARLADTASEMAQTHPLVASAIRNSDFDADIMDIVLQMDTFGEIVYG
jgi:hypothetical protein